MKTAIVKKILYEPLLALKFGNVKVEVIGKLFALEEC